MTKGNLRGWIFDVVAGAIAGGIVGAIIAVNIVVYAGPDQGYESSFRDVFDHSRLVGIAAAAALTGGPILGVVLARMFRRSRHRSSL